MNREQAEKLTKDALDQLVVELEGGRSKRLTDYLATMARRLLHDLRRSAVRNLVRAGASEQVSMSITGHKTRWVFDRYHIVSSSDQVEAVRKLAALHGAVAREPRKV